MGCENLSELTASLAEHSASLYLLNGGFLVTNGGHLAFNVPLAVEVIRTSNPGVRIYLFSEELNIEGLATNLGMDYFGKGVYSSNSLVEELSKILEKSA